jgi:hypothetical protein
MNAIANKNWPRRADTPSSGDRRQKILLAGLLVVLVAVLAWQVPKLLGGSEASSEAAPAAVAATPVVTEVGAGTESLGGAAVALSPKEKQTARWIKKLPARDPFVALVGAPTAAAVPAPETATPAPAPNPEPAKPKPAAAPKVAPSAAVIWTNGRRQVVGVKQQFKVGDTTFRLLSVTGTSVKIAPVLGGFEGGEQAITIRKTEPLTFENATTGVQYVLRYSLAMSAVPASGGK